MFSIFFQHFFVNVLNNPTYLKSYKKAYKRLCYKLIIEDSLNALLTFFQSANIRFFREKTDTNLQISLKNS